MRIDNNIAVMRGGVLAKFTLNYCQERLSKSEHEIRIKNMNKS